MLEDSQASLIVTDLHYFPLAAGLARGCHILNIDELNFDLSDKNPGLTISPNAPASIRYTSGSTGQPKGSSKSHKDELFDLMYETNFFHLCAEDRLTHLVFNASGGQFFRALLNGAAIFPMNLKEEGLTSLASWLMGQGITFLHLAPTLFRHFIGTLNRGERFPNLRLIRLQGEPVHKRDVDLFRSHFAPDCILVNSISATETGLFRLYYVDQNTRITGSLVPVGYGVEGKEVFLLDDSGEEVGFDKIGEIVVRSSFLPQSNWAKPGTTQANFRTDLEWSSERNYRTGDLGRMLSDGCLIHLGRKDLQVKVRGNRIEIPEIEQRLLSLDNVKEAVVVAREGPPGEPRLVAYVVSARQPAPTVTALRSGLLKTLPDYMIPSSFVRMKALPLLPIGKVDLLSLPAPGRGRPELENPFTPPRTAVEEALAEIWVKVLEIDEVGIADNFFDLGGNSLMAMKAIASVERAIGLDIQPREFTYQSLGQLAASFEERMSQAQSGRASTIRRLLKRVMVIKESIRKA